MIYFSLGKWLKKLEGIELIVNLIALIQEWKWAKIYLVRKVDFLFVN